MTTESLGNNPYQSPADLGTLIGTLRFTYAKMMQSTDGMLPARVLAFNRTTNRVQVEIMIAMVTTDGAQVSRAQLASIPVFQIGGGGYVLNFPLQTGDLGWIIANDRDISLFLQSYSEAAPNTHRVKSFSDAVFFPNVMTAFSIDSEDADHPVLQNLDGTIRVALWPDRVKITSPLLEITGDLQVDGVITGVGLSPITISSPVIMTGGASVSGGGANALTVTGNHRVVGDITASGTITPGVP